MYVDCGENTEGVVDGVSLLVLGNDKGVLGGSRLGDEQLAEVQRTVDANSVGNRARIR